MLQGTDYLLELWRSLLLASPAEETKPQTGELPFEADLKPGSPPVPIEDALSAAIQQTMVTLNLPSGDDYARLASQLTAIEGKIDRLAPPRPKFRTPVWRPARLRQPLADRDAF